MTNKARFQEHKIFSPLNNDMKQPKLVDALTNGEDLLEEFNFFKRPNKLDQTMSDLGMYSFPYSFYRGR